MESALSPQLELFTLDQYEALPEDHRVEVFDGVVYDMASPSQEHQTISMELSTILILISKAIMAHAGYFTLRLM